MKRMKWKYDRSGLKILQMWYLPNLLAKSAFTPQCFWFFFSDFVYQWINSVLVVWTDHTKRTQKFKYVDALK